MTTPSMRALLISFAAIAGLALFTGDAAAAADSASPPSGEFPTEGRGPEPMSCSDAIDLANYRQQISVDEGEGPPNDSLVPAPRECVRDIVVVMTE